MSPVICPWAVLAVITQVSVAAHLQKKAGVPDPGLPNKEVKLLGRNASLRLLLASLLLPCSTFSRRRAPSQEGPKLFAAAEGLTFAIADTFYQPRQFPAAVDAAPVYPDEVAVQGWTFRRRRDRTQDTVYWVTDRIRIELTVIRE